MSILANKRMNTALCKVVFFDKSFTRWLRVFMLLSVLPTSPALADGGVTYTDIAAGDGAGIDYRRLESFSDAIFDALKQKPVYTIPDVILTPFKPRGAPGVAIFDYDNDDDFDIYVTNGPAANNSLYSNQLKETGNVSFVDVGVEAGVEAFHQDSTGVCYGDIDNDGDQDLLVLGNAEPNLLFENRGDGSFIDITLESGIGNTERTSASCTLGDVDNDGRLDLFVGNFASWDNQIALFSEPFALSQHNELYRNVGNNKFTDISATSGIEVFVGLPPGAATLTWAVATVDYDQDGDVDIFTADDQGPFFSGAEGGIDRGYVRVFQNDGTGSFMDVSTSVGTDIPGSWMGVAFGDLNSDDNIDFFSTNFGVYLGPTLVNTSSTETRSSWFLGQNDGTFVLGDDPTLLGAPFGWGAAITDYDNDGDQDIIYHGGMDVSLSVLANNPGSILRNDGDANFGRDLEALAQSTNHTRRTVHGMVVGDIDQNGLVDIVSVSNFDFPEPTSLIPPFIPIDSPFFPDALFVPTFRPIGDRSNGRFVWSGIEFQNGTLSVELSSADNDNKWAAVRTLGGAGLIPNGTVNRNGIGAILKFTPLGGNTVIKPIVGGSSYASQHALEQVFGLGTANRGDLEVIWPGGVRNHLFNVLAEDRVTMPEIPCSLDDDWPNLQSYVECVRDSLRNYQNAGVIDAHEGTRLTLGAYRAFLQERN